MPSFGGSVLRLTATLLYALEFCCAGIILGIYSYFLSVLADRNQPISRDNKAIEGLSGVAVVYTIFAVLLTCFLGGVRFFAFLGILLDLCFVGAFIALAVLTRSGDSSCNGFVNTPIGTGNAFPGQDGQGFRGPNGNRVTYAVSLRTACKLNTACFAVAIVGAVLFFISMFLQIWVARHHQKEKKYGPSPANDYTSGSGSRKFWKRKNKTTKDTELGAVNGDSIPYGNGASTTAYGTSDYRPSADTGYTGTTVNGGHNTATGHKYENTYQAPTGTAVDHAGYQAHGANVNPYGYNTTATTGTAQNF